MNSEDTAAETVAPAWKLLAEVPDAVSKDRTACEPARLKVLDALIGLEKAGKPEGLSFRYESASDGAATIRRHEGQVEPVAGAVYVYATIHMGPANPINYVGGRPQWRPEEAVVAAKAPAAAEGAAAARHPFMPATEGVAAELDLLGFAIQENPLPEGRPPFLETIALGSKTQRQSTPVARFGLGNDGRGQERAHRMDIRWPRRLLRAVCSNGGRNNFPVPVGTGGMSGTSPVHITGSKATLRGSLACVTTLLASVGRCSKPERIHQETRCLATTLLASVERCSR